MARALIIGSTSAVGRAIGRRLSDEFEVFFAGRKNADIFLDLESEDDIDVLGMEFDLVLHVAANFGGNSSNGLWKAEKINALGTIRVGQLATKVNAKHFVLISTMSVLYQPGDAYYGDYSLSKKHAEELAELYCLKNNLKLTILRPSQLYDKESQCRKHQGLFYSIVDTVESGDDVCLYGTNDALRNLMYLDDFSEIVYLVIQKAIYGVFNCPFPKYVRLTEIVNTAFRVFGTKGSAEFDRNRPDIADLPLCTDHALYEELNYYPKYDLLKGIEMIKNERNVK